MKSSKVMDELREIRDKIRLGIFRKHQRNFQKK